MSEERVQDKVYEMLKELGIEYEMMEHPAVFTIEEMDQLGITEKGGVCKNLFLRDEKGKRHFLVVLEKDKTADLKKIRDQIGSTRLSFASADRLAKHLKLTQGEVTPLGVINDEAHAVEVVLDKDIQGKDSLGFHPNTNTATVWISFDDLMKYLNHFGNKVKFVKI
jgi:Ala-tRNA(Pro) deacylase